LNAFTKRTGGEARELVRRGAVGWHHEPVEGFVDRIRDVDDHLPGELVGVSLDGSARVRVVHGEDDHLGLERIADHGGPDDALTADVGRDRLGSLRVLADDREVMPAREHAAADAPRHVAGADQRDMHVSSRLSLRLRCLRCRLGDGWTSS